MPNNRLLAPIVLCVCAACAIPACGGYTTVDGYDAAYVEAPPAGIEYYPRYRFRDGYVYNVDGRYYHQHAGRWLVYRNAPPEVVHARPEVRYYDRGRAERQR